MANIPEDILNSAVLNDSDFELLKSISELPDETEVNEYKLLELSELFIELEDQKNQLEIALHRLAKEKLKENDIENAWKTLLSFNN